MKSYKSSTYAKKKKKTLKKLGRDRESLFGTNICDINATPLPLGLSHEVDLTNVSPVIILNDLP